MNKFVRRILCLLCIIVLGMTSYGFSYFYFENQQEVTNKVENNIRTDDIEENYDFGRNSEDKEGKTYTIYFFPSASYLHLYSLYLLDTDTVTVGGYTNSKTSTKPEDQFGYKEPTYNDDGSLATDSNGDVIYKLSENTGKYASENNISEPLTYDGGYRKFMGERFSCSKFEADGGVAYGNNSKGITSAYSQSQNFLSNNWRAKRTWGLPSANEDFTIFNEDSSSNYNDPDRVEHFNGRNQYSGDRLGSWGDCYYYGYTMRDNSDDALENAGLILGESTSTTTDSAKAMNDTNTGRYLPIKLTVTNELVSSVIEKVIPSIFTSMGTELSDTYTYQYLHNYTFTEWTYVKNPNTKKSQDSSDYPYSPVRNTGEWTENKVGEAFQPVPTDTYFDMLTDLDKYADSDGVIRLFPLFSNSKKSSATTYTNGGGSSERLKITSSSSDVSYQYPFFNSDVYNYDDNEYFTYPDDSGNEKTNNLLKSEYIRLFSFNNVDITSEKASTLEFSANNVMDNPTGWLYDTKTSGDTTIKYLQWKKLYVLTTEYIKNNLIAQYGEGLYTFYMFVANYSYQNGPLSTTTIDEEHKTAADEAFNVFYNNIVSQAMDGKFASLKGKRIIQIDSSMIDDEMKEGDKPYTCSPTVIAFEKIDEPTLTISSTNNTDITRNFYRNVNPLFEGMKSGDKYCATGDDLTPSSPYTYLVKNVDLSKEGSNFVITMNNSTSSTNVFNTSNNNMEYDYLVSNPSDKDNVSEENIFVKPFSSDGEDGYIKADTSNPNKIIFNVTSLNELDVYDILIKFNVSNEKYDIYMRRHDKLFVYIFDRNIGDAQSNGFVDHSFTYDEGTKCYINTNNKSSTAVLLFDGYYSAGYELSSSDKSSKSNTGMNIDECLQLVINISQKEKTCFRLRDRVTGEVVGRYIANEDGTYSLVINLTVKKNYILYLEYYAG